MPTFRYEALNKQGKTEKGSISAANGEDAMARLRAQNFFPTSIREEKIKKSRKSASGGAAGTKGKGKKSKKKNKKKGPITINIGGVSQKHLTDFTRQLSTLQDAGLPILRSLSILEQQQKPGLFKNILMNAHDDVSGGATLSDAMAANPKAFDRLYTKMIAAGEVGGVLDLILQRLADFMEKSAKLKRKLVGAMIYPVVVIFIAVLLVTAVMYFVIPKFEATFADFDVDLPYLTTVLIKMSKWIAGTSSEDQTIPGAIPVILSPIVFFLAFKLMRKIPAGQKIQDIISLRLPVFGNLIRKTSIAKFTRTLGTLIHAGVPILDAILITRDTSANVVYRNALNAVHDSVRNGESLGEPLRKAKVCDSLVVNMIEVGEETGDLDVMLNKVADNYDDEVDTIIASLVSLLEPIIIVVLGGVVLVIVLALFLPLTAILEKLSK